MLTVRNLTIEQLKQAKIITFGRSRGRIQLDGAEVDNITLYCKIPCATFRATGYIQPHTIGTFNLQDPKNPQISIAARRLYSKKDITNGTLNKNIMLLHENGIPPPWKQCNKDTRNKPLSTTSI